MVRTIITPTDTNIHLSISKEYVGKSIEITYLALKELEPKTVTKRTLAQFWGTISDETAQKLRDSIEKTRGEWERDI